MNSIPLIVLFRDIGYCSMVLKLPLATDIGSFYARDVNVVSDVKAVSRRLV